MLELIHTLITSLLLSAAVGCGTEVPAAGEDEPGDQETGTEVGSLASYLVAPRGHAPTHNEPGDDDLPDALGAHDSFCEPTVWLDQPAASVYAPAPALGFPTAGRSP